MDVRPNSEQHDFHLFIGISHCRVLCDLLIEDVSMRSTITCLIFGAGIAGCFPQLPLDPPTENLDATSDDDVFDGSADDDSDEVDDEPMVDLSIQGVVPFDGSNAGGLEVVVTGGPFEVDVKVWFGEADGSLQLGEVVGVSENALQVIVPESTGFEGLVDVVITSGEQEAVLEESFRYWADASDEAILLASWSHIDVANVDHWSNAPEGLVMADALFIEPQDIYYSDLMSAGLDSCAFVSTGVDLVAGPNQFEMIGEGEAVDMVIDEDDLQYSYFDEIEGMAYSPVALDLVIDEEGEYPAFQMDESLVSPSALSVLAPAIADASIPSMSMDDAEIRWADTDGDFVYIGMVDLDSGSDESVACVAANDGDFTIPENVLGDFHYTWDWSEMIYVANVQIVVISYNEMGSVVEFNNGEVRTQGGYGLIGAVNLETEWTL